MVYLTWQLTRSEKKAAVRWIFTGMHTTTELFGCLAADHNAHLVAVGSSSRRSW
jgi:hypothetical protein